MNATMTPADRETLITRARSLAPPVASCVAASIRPDHLIADASWEQLAALVIVLAEAADPVRLRAVSVASEDGPGVEEEARLRAAHAQVRQLRQAGKPVPLRLRVLDNQYRAGRAAARAKGERAA